MRNILNEILRKQENGFPFCCKTIKGEIILEFCLVFDKIKLLYVCKYSLLKQFEIDYIE